MVSSLASDWHTAEEFGALKEPAAKPKGSLRAGSWLQTLLS